MNNQPISFPAMNMNQLIVYQQNMRLQAQVGDMVLYLQDKKQEDIDVGSPQLLSFIETSVYGYGS